MGNPGYKMKKCDVSIVIPAYNEEKSIRKVVTDVLKAVKSLKFNVEIIVVDDGSSDGTSDAVSDLKVRIIKHPNNKGYGASLKTGALNANGDYVLYIDGDDQHYAEDIKSFFIDYGKYDMIVGMRSKDASLIRRWGKLFINILANYLAERKIPDVNSGFRLIKKDLVLKYLQLLPNTFSFTTTITLALIKGAYNISYIPIRIKPRKSGKSAIKPIRDGFRFIMLILRMTILFSPLRVFLPVSFLLFLVGIPLLLSRLILYQRASETAVLFVLSGLLILFFGLIADQISILLRKGEGF